MNINALRQVQARRISTDNASKPPIDESCDIAVEGPVTIDIDGVGTYTVLCTPDDKRAMAVGFMFSEGIIDSVGDIAILNECLDAPEVMRVRLSEGAPDTDNVGRNLLIVSSCGICGSEGMDEKLAAMPKVGNTLTIGRELLYSTSRDLSENQVLFKKCGGTHAVGIFDAKGQIMAFAEDIGRHNALDKAIGKCLLMGKSTAGCGAILSGRISLEMVGKCARAGIELITAVSATTSLALDAAEHCNITVLAFVRDTRATIFAGPERVVD
ncbi:MAG: formate dehydrogenase accessory sulfurtransferase FdhD [Proteobacteria bacterium]|nr:formate dehydrogenase accessory sulfurtransferase FdhD [Pseudomonadota bacterium]